MNISLHINVLQIMIFPLFSSIFGWFLNYKTFLLLFHSIIVIVVVIIVVIVIISIIKDTTCP